MSDTDLSSSIVLLRRGMTAGDPAGVVAEERQVPTQPLLPGDMFSPLAKDFSEDRENLVDLLLESDLGCWIGTSFPGRGVSHLSSSGSSPLGVGGRAPSPHTEAHWDTESGSECCQSGTNNNNNHVPTETNTSTTIYPLKQTQKQSFTY
ncbi:hypothetical protein AAFF_G00431310 [Aldrovandia affinis]|uniref:Uncharacterized protein n=1 Tax=Aldrovandia affinis TaxID=143900 RepID=A0AAD7WJ81_9TELE|nr:hypothetical protein AAFF_G00431310 [Aldrovandia affinis]